MKTKVDRTPRRASWNQVVRMARGVVRPGSMAILERPSRIGGSLFWPDGRVTREESGGTA